MFENSIMQNSPQSLVAVVLENPAGLATPIVKFLQIFKNILEFPRKFHYWQF